MLDFSVMKDSEKRLVLLVDEVVCRLYPSLFEGETCLRITASEQEKNWSTVAKIIDQLLAMEVDRNTFLLGVGGGVTTDLCGFVASIYKRGISFGFVPTTLLAMVDASIGGKNGINWGLCKNEVGLIRMPEQILLDLDFLRTLPVKEFYSGVAELLKVFLLADRDSYAVAMDLFKRVPDPSVLLDGTDRQRFEELVQEAIRIKERIVEQDTYEAGPRRLLNFGHTLGHALELILEEEGLGCTHGQAVAWGMVQMVRWSVRRVGLAQTTAMQLVSDFRSVGLPVDWQDLGLDMPALLRVKKKMASVLCQDKKREGDALHMVLLKEMGIPVVLRIPLTEVEELLDRL